MLQFSWEVVCFTALRFAAAFVVTLSPYYFIIPEGVAYPLKSDTYNLSPYISF